MILAAGRKGDVLVAISTSGNSQNILNAMVAAKKQGMIVIRLTGNSGGKMAFISDILVNVPSIQTPHIQEAHITIGHILCDIIETTLFPIL